MSSFNVFLSGVITAQYIVACVFFLRYAKKTSDTLFRFFAAAFVLLAIERIALVCLGGNNEFRPIVYFFRLAAFLVIIAAILRKNRQIQS